MSRTLFIAGVTLVLVSGAHASLARSDDSTKPAASAKPAAEELVPGFESKGLTWGQLKRMVLIESGIRQRDRKGKEHSKHVSRVEAFLVANGGNQPVTIDQDPLAKPLPEKLEGVDFVARLQERGGLWKEKLLTHNPAVSLDVRHQDTRTRASLSRGAGVENQIHYQKNLHAPSEELLQKAFAVNAADVLEKTRPHSANKVQMRFWYYLANAALGCVAVVIFGFLVLPTIRRRRAESAQGDR